MGNTLAKDSTHALAIGTNDSEAHPNRWFVARVQMNCEKRSALRINSLGIETFVPTQSEIHQWSDRRKKIERIVLPMLVFFRAQEAKAREIERLSFVRALMRAPGENRIATIPDDQIERFKFMLGHSDAEVTINHRVNKGDKVRIVRGKLQGLEGVVTTASDNRSIVSIAIDYIGYASIIISKSDLEIIT
ncbi:MAG: UpxY family transcription antiterminator [Bacteroidales bacterium]|nr:UpxY family transcription antiterminator [Bacteroidales bacterium]